MALEFTKLSEVTKVESLSEVSNMMIEDGGEIKRVPANAVGKVKTVNGAEPDENGNITIELPEMPEIPECKVKTVNGIEPDENGNVEVPQGAKHWNDLEGKPFGEGEDIVFVDGDIEIEFDGDTEDYCGSVSMVNPVEWSDGMTAHVVFSETFGISFEGDVVFHQYGDSCREYITIDDDYGAIDAKLTVNSSSCEIRFDSSFHDTTGHISITIPGETKTLNPKFLPEEVAWKSDIPEIPEHTWESLPDKPFGKTEGEVISILEESTYSPDPYSSTDTVNRYFVGVHGLTIENDALPKSGTIKTTINGIDYIGDVRVAENNDGSYNLYAGNGAIFNANFYEDTGEDYCSFLCYASNACNLDITVCTKKELADGEATFSIEQDTSTTKLLDLAYLPKHEHELPEHLQFGKTEGEIIDIYAEHTHSVYQTKTYNDQPLYYYYPGVNGLYRENNALPKSGTITTIINGISYTGVVKVNEYTGGYALLVGNHALVSTSYEDTGESYCVLLSCASNAMNLDIEVYTTDAPQTVTYPNGNTGDGATISIEQDTSTITTLDPDYLPKASAIADVTEAPTAEQFNALLASLRAAGYLAT